MPTKRRPRKLLSTSRSRSLLSVAVPFATEPKSTARFTPCARNTGASVVRIASILGMRTPPYINSIYHFGDGIKNYFVNAEGEIHIENSHKNRKALRRAGYCRGGRGSGA